MMDPDGMRTIAPGLRLDPLGGPSESGHDARQDSGIAVHILTPSLKKPRRFNRTLREKMGNVFPEIQEVPHQSGEVPLRILMLGGAVLHRLDERMMLDRPAPGNDHLLMTNLQPPGKLSRIESPHA